MATDEDFDAAFHLARLLAHESKWAGYVAYLELRSKGLRQPALKCVRAFAETAANWPFEERWQFTQSVLDRLHPFWTRDIPLPHPLVERLFRPTLTEAAEYFSDDPWPPYWLGQDGIFDWRALPSDFDRDRFSSEALRRAPDFQPALKDLVSLLLSRVGFEQHELPHGYLGDPLKSLEALAEARGYLSRLPDNPYRDGLQAKLVLEEQSARQYLAFQSEADGTYRQWCDERGLPY